MGPLEAHFFNIGYQQGLEESLKKVAKSMLAAGKSIELIQKCTDLPAEELQALIVSLTLRPASQPKNDAST